MINNPIHNKIDVAIVIISIATSIFISCSNNNTKTIATTDRKNLPQITADSITTIISDSGIIRYRIFTNKWDVFDKKDTPYWDFPIGIRFERFASDLSIDAEVECNKAVYYNKIELWKLNNNVKAVNLSGEEFYTNELYWDQKKEKVYSDSAIKIIQKDKIIEGVGFESNQTFTKYVIRRPKGVIPIDKE